MVTLNDSLLSSSARKLPIHKRADLTASRHYYLGQSYWVVKDPLGLQYYRFQEEEYAILQMLNGQMSLDEIKDKFEEDFPPQKITLDELHRFLGMLHRSGLIVSMVPGQGRELRKRRGERRRQQALQVLTNILCLRFKGIDPERLLDWLHPKLRWIYSPLVMTVCMLLGLSALLLVLVQFDVFRRKLPEFHQFFNFYNAMWLTVVLAVTKIIHEFGHGVTCKHFGGECHELGFMLLVLTPCLYCNVSDSWMLPNKWHRIAIGGAGMFVEIMLASIATFVWWWTEPGLINNLCLNTMFICSVSTVLFNGNPLMRYDGYYMLADLTEIPNLRQKSTTILGEKMGQWFLGLEPTEDPFLPKRNQFFFATYSIASAIYRWVIMLSILLFLYKFWKPYRLEIIGDILGLMTLYGLVVYPLWRLGKFFYVPGRLDKVKKSHMYPSLAGVAVLLVAAFVVPLPHHVMCTLETQARNAAMVYVDVPGRVEEVAVKVDDEVRPGQLIAQLKDRELELAINKLTASRDQFQSQLENLRHQRFRDAKAGAEIPQVTEALAAVEEQLKQKQSDLARLRLVAPRAGTVLPPPLTPHREDPEGRLSAWSGTPLEPENLGAYLEPGVLFCQVGNPNEMEAILVIDQADVEFVAPGQQVDIKLNELPHETLTSKIVEIANLDLKVTPHRLSSKAGGEVASHVDPNSGVERPMSTSYQARVPLDDPERLMRIGLRGQAKIHTAWRPLAVQIWWFCAHAFNFRM